MTEGETKGHMDDDKQRSRQREGRTERWTTDGQVDIPERTGLQGIEHVQQVVDLRRLGGGERAVRSSMPLENSLSE